LAFTVTNCGDDDDSSETVVITVDDAAEYVAATLTIATYIDLNTGDVVPL
jgi:hypothetical protein